MLDSISSGISTPTLIGYLLGLGMGFFFGWLFARFPLKPQQPGSAEVEEDQIG